MEIVVAGTGYVGLVTGVCLAEKGHNVTCVDVDESKIELMQKGIAPIYEEGLQELMSKNQHRLTYTTDYKSAYEKADVIFIGVGTPEKVDGSANLKYVYTVAGQIAESVKRDCVIVVKSTVPIGTNDKVEMYIRENLKNPVHIDCASNPEFLSQGTAVRDTLYASRIVIGAENEETKQKMLEVYKNFDAPKLVTDRRSAEMIKYASNDFLALKISYINEIANFCEIVGANIQDVAQGMGLDSRIGNRFLHAGIGYGGSCFPKDTKALHWLGNYYDNEFKTIKAAIEVNENQKLKLLKKARQYYTSLEGLTVAVLGLTFKPGTNDLREAPSILNVGILLDDGAKIKAYDPIAEKEFNKIYPGKLQYAKTPEEALEGADLCMIFTEWPEIKALTPENFCKSMNKPIILDGRNCYEVEAFSQKPLVYNSIGRKTVDNLKSK